MMAKVVMNKLQKYRPEDLLNTMNMKTKVMVQLYNAIEAEAVITRGTARLWLSASEFAPRIPLLDEKL
jgi:hypothetical protein